MLSRQLWVELRQPPLELPLMPAFKRPQFPRSRQWWLGLGSLLAIMAWLCFSSANATQFITILYVLGVVAPVLVLLFNGTLLGAFWAYKTYDLLSRLNRDGVADLLGVVPSPAGGWMWWMMRSRLVKQRNFHAPYQVIRALTVIALSALLFAFALVLLGSLSRMSESLWVALTTLLALMGWVVVLWLDHTQSIVVGHLVGAVLAKYTPNEVITPILPFVISVIAQLFFYFFILGLWAMLMGGVLPVATSLSTLLLPVLCVLVREIQVRYLWQMLV